MSHARRTAAAAALLVLMAALHAAPDTGTALSRTAALREAAEAAGAPQLSPLGYAAGVKALDAARRQRDTDPADPRIDTLLDQAATHFRDAAAQSARARPLLLDALANRAAARDAEAWHRAPAQWKKAEQRLLDAARKLERGDARAATALGIQASALYADAELQAVRAQHLAPVWGLMRDAEQARAARLVPLTYERARQLQAAADAALAAARRTPEEALPAIRDAERAARQAIGLAGVADDLRRGGASSEQVLLDLDQTLSDTAAAAGLGPRRIIGNPAAARQLLADARALGERVAMLEREVAERDRQIVGLEEELRELDQRLGGAAAERERLVMTLEARQRQRDLLASLEAMFGRDEGSVLQSSGRIVLRLHGLSFRPGSAELDPRSAPLLDKAIQALAMFPRASIVVEGHTDSTGDDRANVRLSETRAMTVQRQLAPPIQRAGGRVESVGHGESQPVASNDSAEGRARNRRIDILITPDPATWLQ